MRAAGLREMRYGFDFEGSKVLVNFLDGGFSAGVYAPSTMQTGVETTARSESWPA